ncbi:MAG: hypothetical protein J2P58_06700 [Acidimicrobiaceae bacterium]|nr:hypothetical protein [Acidimicrobiaceae bacterium]
MVDIATDPICTEALRLAGEGGGDDAVERLVELAGTDRASLVAARDAFASRLHGHADDYAATAALRLLNRAIAAYGWSDPYDWRGRLGNRLLKP